MEYYLFDPSGNITVLIPVVSPADCRQADADMVMRREPSAEQAGFVLSGDTQCDIELRMAGGEFCGNASLCTAALFAMQNHLRIGSSIPVRLRASGCAEILTAQITAQTDGYTGSIVMPRIRGIIPFETGDAALPTVPMVTASGITHAVVPMAMGLDWAEARIRPWCEAMHADALGIMLLSEDHTELTPVVYVPASNTLFREHSCASGTAAVGAYLAAQAGKRLVCDFHEPGGTLRVTASPDGTVTLENSIRLQRRCTL